MRFRLLRLCGCVVLLSSHLLDFIEGAHHIFYHDQALFEVDDAALEAQRFQNFDLLIAQVGIPFQEPGFCNDEGNGL